MNKLPPLYPDSFLEPENMIKLYALGAFPMAEDKFSQTINWYMPEIRTIIPIGDYNIPRTLKSQLKKCKYLIKTDANVIEVINHCREREESWISPKLIEAYMNLYNCGYLHTVEVYQGNDLIGGLYGIAYKGAFFGESMFSAVSQASKIALAHLLEHLKNQGFSLLDVQYQTEHLQMFGATQISMENYNLLLRAAYKQDTVF